ncbi:MAG: DNA starvation/stationary phase protection protein [Bacteroidetes bacterium RIFCSPHIGHO2_02_FULL_44_7]|nr:MAG: DNA starvation/stationary phase protection protein [Bacteroidetes bacterium RIFCSPHIGHO2_02_FULL_44_7]
MKSQMEIIDANRQSVAEELAKILADETILYTKTKNAYWNLSGPDAYEKHKFEMQFGELDEIIAQVAQYICSLGHHVPATLKSYLRITRLSEATSQKSDNQSFIEELIANHESTIAVLREQIQIFTLKLHDTDSANFVRGLIKTHEKMAWFLRSHLTK